MDQIATYNMELDKLDKLEHNYWRQWGACDQEDRKNLKYLDGVRWCMTHRLKLLAKLATCELSAGRLPVQPPEQTPYRPVSRDQAEAAARQAPAVPVNGRPEGEGSPPSGSASIGEEHVEASRTQAGPQTPPPGGNGRGG